MVLTKTWMARWRKMSGKHLLIFSLPAVLLYTLFFIYPTFNGILYSFTDWDGISKNFNFVFLENYMRLASIKDFKAGFGNTIIYSLGSLVLLNTFALILAIAVTSIKAFKNLFKTAIFMPVMISSVVVAYLWQIMYRYEDGVINVALGAMGLGFLKGEWLGNPDIAIYSIIVVATWQLLGYYLVIYATGIENVPTELYESADIDGATFLHKQVHITLPMIAPVFTICLVLSTINGFKTFELPFIMTGGGPVNATESITTLVLRYSFQNNEFGMACAYSMVLLVMISSVTFIQAKFLRKREVDL